MAISVGYKSKAAFRISKRANTYPITTAEADTSRQILGKSDLIPMLSESLIHETRFDPDKVMGGQAGVTSLTKTALRGSGNITLEGQYLGLDELIYAALGWEYAPILTATAAGYSGSPIFKEASGDDEEDVVASASGTTFVVAGTPFDYPDGICIGDYLRTEKRSAASEGNIVDQLVFRIISLNSASSAEVYPAIPNYIVAGDYVHIGRAFTHTFECTKNIEEEAFTYGSAAGMYRVRHGTLCIDKTIDPIWEWRAVMVESMTIRLKSDQIVFEFGLVPFDLDRASSSNTASTTWQYSAMVNGSSVANYLQERMKFAQAVFRIKNYSTSSALAAGDSLAISEFELNFKNNLAADIAETKSGYYRAEPIRNGLREITGSFTIPRYQSDTLINNYDDETLKMADLVLTGSALTDCTSTNTFKLFLRSLKIIKASPNIAGAGVTPIKFEFQCLQPVGDPASMPSETSGSDNSEIMIQTVNNNPFNAMMTQKNE